MRKVKLSITYEGVTYESVIHTLKNDEEIKKYEDGVRSGLTDRVAFNINTKDCNIIFSPYILERSIIRIIEVE